MTDTDRCGALWDDQLNPTAARTRCTLEAGHNGPHHAGGTTWGAPDDWDITYHQWREDAHE